MGEKKMISGTDFYHVMTGMVPLYVAMILAYGSVKWWKVFSPDQCSGINKFVALFAVPLLSFHFISDNNPYDMNFLFIAADTLQKVIILVVLAIWARVSSRGSIEWTITLFSLLTLPNTLVMGIPLLQGMYGAFSSTLVVQIVVLQCIIWYTLLLFLFEYRGAKLLISEQFPDTAGSIRSFRVDSDVTSLDGKEPLETEAEVGEDGKLHVKVKRSTSSGSEVFSRHSHGVYYMTRTPSNMSDAEIYSLSTPRGSRGASFSLNDPYSFINGKDLRNFSQRTSMGSDEEIGGKVQIFGSRKANAEIYPLSLRVSSPVVGPRAIARDNDDGQGGKDNHMFVRSSSASSVSKGVNVIRSGSTRAGSDSRRMFVRSSSASSVSKALNVVRGGSARIAPDYGHKLGGVAHLEGDGDQGKDQLSSENRPGENGPEGEVLTTSKGGLSSINEVQPDSRPNAMPPASVMTKLILIMVWRKLIRNPNTYASLIGLIWSLISFRWNIKMPAIVAASIKILSDTGLGMAMFSLGLFMALQPKIIACGKKKAGYSALARFIVGPFVMAAASAAVGLRGNLLRIAIVQAVLPQGIVPFVFAKEYNLHADILSTGVIFGMLVAVPITLVYYVVLGLM